MKRVVVKFQYESICPYCLTLEHTLIKWLKFGVPNERIVVFERDEKGNITYSEKSLHSIIVEEAKRMGLNDNEISELFERKPIVLVEEMVDVNGGKVSDSVVPARRMGIPITFEVPSITIEFYKDGKLVNRVVVTAPTPYRIEELVAFPGNVKEEVARLYARIKHIIDLFLKQY